jgi:glutaryl-CoA dehydrogenase
MPWTLSKVNLDHTLLNTPKTVIARSKPANFNWEDPFLLEDQLTEEERMIRDTAKAYCQIS